MFSCIVKSVELVPRAKIINKAYNTCNFICHRGFVSQKDESLSPSARHLILRNKLDVHSIAGTGRRGMIMKEDVLKFLANPQSTQKINQPISKPSVSSPSKEFEDIPNSNIRKVIAKRLTLSKTTIPHGYASIEIQIDQLLNLRTSLNASNKGVKLSINDFVIRACSLALADVPQVNSSWDTNTQDIVPSHTVDISVAVATEKGLFTPIVKNANMKGIGVVSQEMQDLAARAREGKLKPEEFQGGSFSISNLGMFAIDEFAPIINPPQVANLAVGKGKQVVVPNEFGLPSIKQQLKVTLSCDQRAVDEETASLFLDKVKQYLSYPQSLL